MAEFFEVARIQWPFCGILFSDKGIKRRGNGGERECGSQQIVLFIVYLHMVDMNQKRSPCYSVLCQIFCKNPNMILQKKEKYKRGVNCHGCQKIKADN